MPSRDPQTGKPLSGSAKRRLAKEAARAAPAPAAAAPGAAGPAAAPAAAAERVQFAPLAGAPLAGFEDIQPPPLGRPVEAIAWVNDVVLRALYNALCDPTLKGAERYRWIKDFSAVVGMIRDKAAEQAAIKDAMRDASKQEANAGTVSADGRRKTPVEKPPG